MEYIEINPPETPQSTIIWLHGLGADGHDFVDIVPELQLPKDLATRFVFPHAPLQPVTLNRGLPMRAWFDIYGLTKDSLQDEIGIRASQKIIDNLISDETNKGIKPEKIVLAGFSQGGALALHTGLRYPKRLAGILALSTFLPLATTLSKEKSPANQHISIMMAHGTHDSVLKYDLGASSRDGLIKLGYSVQWHSYPMEHTVCQQEVADIAGWLTNLLMTKNHSH